MGKDAIVQIRKELAKAGPAYSIPCMRCIAQFVDKFGQEDQLLCTFRHDDMLLSAFQVG